MTDPKTQVVTRFPPSPTGFLHIGGARTALFNWLFARGRGGTFLLRIEDTDRARSTPEAVAAIHQGLEWLGLDYDGAAISQVSRQDRHAEVARSMLEAGTAYRCYATQDEIAAFRAAAQAEKRSTLFQSPWRDTGPSDWPDRNDYAIRLRAPRDGEITVDDRVQGTVTWKAETLDDLILLRSDGTPTYMLAVVVDDHDMGVTHVIRGDDHLTNAARQALIYDALGWDRPVFAHIPLIHGADGAKMSKRHGATSVTEYRDMGYLPVAMRNYLARLGWSHGDDEFFTDAQALEWFGLDGIGKAPARFDFAKLASLNAQHMRAMAPADLMAALDGHIAAQQHPAIDGHKRAMLLQALPDLAERAKTLPEVLDMAYYILADRPLQHDEKSAQQITDDSRALLARLTERLRDASRWGDGGAGEVLKAFAEAEGLKLGKVAQPLRAVLTGRAASPGVFNVMETLGQAETVARIDDVLTR